MGLFGIGKKFNNNSYGIDKKSEWKGENGIKDELKNNSRPELTEYIDSISEYKNIVIAGPCWWGTFPCAVMTQLEKLDFTGKKVFAVMTHEGSGLGSSVRTLKNLCRGAEIGEGLAVFGSSAPESFETVSDWAQRNLV